MSLIRALYQRSKVLMIVALLANVLSATLGVVLIAMINQSVASGDFHFTGGIPLFVATKLGIDMQIGFGTQRVLTGEATPEEAATELMARQLKSETE